MDPTNQAELDSANARVAAGEAELAALQGEIAALQGEIAALQGEIADINARTAKLQAENERLERRIAEFPALDFNKAVAAEIVRLGCLAHAVPMGLCSSAREALTAPSRNATQACQFAKNDSYFDALTP